MSERKEITVKTEIKQECYDFDDDMTPKIIIQQTYLKNNKNDISKEVEPRTENVKLQPVVAEVSKFLSASGKSSETRFMKHKSEDKHNKNENLQKSPRNTDAVIKMKGGTELLQGLSVPYRENAAMSITGDTVNTNEIGAHVKIEKEPQNEFDIASSLEISKEHTGETIVKYEMESVGYDFEDYAAPKIIMEQIIFIDNKNDIKKEEESMTEQMDLEFMVQDVPEIYGTSEIIREKRFMENKAKEKRCRDGKLEQSHYSVAVPRLCENNLQCSPRCVCNRCSVQSRESLPLNRSSLRPLLHDGQPDLLEMADFHNGEDHYNYGECGESFPHKTNLENQMRVDLGEQPFQCGECGKCFVRKSSLKKHLRVHTGERPFKCGECGRNFSLKSNLEQHQRVHTGERPFKCGECGKNFTWKSNLQHHQFVHTGERPFKCGQCGKRFSDKSKLKTHMLVHTGERPYTCGACGKCFPGKAILQRHQRVHTGERPDCGECGKSFFDKPTLLRHQRVHSGERPFKCGVCGSSFSWKSCLQRHQRVHTIVNGLGRI